jgi:hypothetical protein
MTPADRLEALLGEVGALRQEVHQLLSTLHQPAPAAEWMTVQEAGRVLGMSTRAIYADLARCPGGQLARAASRLGRRLRFNRAGLDSLLRARSRRATMAPRVPPPSGGSRW